MGQAPIHHFDLLTGCEKFNLNQKHLNPHTMSDFSSEVLTITYDGAIATLWLDRPERMNAFNMAFFRDLPRAIQTLSENPDTRAIVIAGKGRAFSVGLDLREMGPLLIQEASELSPVQHRQHLYHTIKRLQAAITAVATCPKPTIAAIHGYCLGAGVDLITACDIRLAAQNARFSVRETRIGIVADLGTLQRLPYLVPAGVVAELVFTGKDISASRALAVHLVNQLYPDPEALIQAAHEWAHEIANNSPLAVQGSKHILAKSRKLSEEEALDYVALWNAAFLQSEDLKEALKAFKEKREPKFTGR